MPATFALPIFERSLRATKKRVGADKYEKRETQLTGRTGGRAGRRKGGDGRPSSAIHAARVCRPTHPASFRRAHSCPRWDLRTRGLWQVRRRHYHDGRCAGSFRRGTPDAVSRRCDPCTVEVKAKWRTEGGGARGSLSIFKGQRREAR